MKFDLSSFALLAVALPQNVSASPVPDHDPPSLSKRNMNMELFEYKGRDPAIASWYTEKSGILLQAQKDAVNLARAAIEELTSDPDHRLLKTYFATKDKDAVAARVKAVYERVVDGDTDGTGGVLLNDIRPVPQQQPGPACLADPNLLVVTAPSKTRVEGKMIAPMSICPNFWTVLKPLQRVVDGCRRAQPKKMSQDMNNMAGTLIHEYTHYNPIGRSKTGLKDIEDLRKSGSPYGLEAAKGFVHSVRTSEGEFNADNYNWFAMHAYMERNCGANGARITLE